MSVIGGGRAAALVIAIAVLAGWAGPGPEPRLTASPSPMRLAGPPPLPYRAVPSAVADQPPVTLPYAKDLIDFPLDLRSGPVPVPLQLEIPSLMVSRPVLAVGITAADKMDAPEGPADDPVWQDAFWYRAGSVPGELGTATIAAHVDDAIGRPGPFAHLNDLRPGAEVIVRDLRTGQNVVFVVDQVDSYALAQAATPGVLAQIYGAGPLAGIGPQQAPDGLSHLTLITCAGTFDYALGTHNHRLVVYTTRVT